MTETVGTIIMMVVVVVVGSYALYLNHIIRQRNLAELYELGNKLLAIFEPPVTETMAAPPIKPPAPQEEPPLPIDPANPPKVMPFPILTAGTYPPCHCHDQTVRPGQKVCLWPLNGGYRIICAKDGQ